MKVYAVIPAHNGGDQLLACLQSLLASTHQATRIIVIDDASTDEQAGREVTPASAHCDLLSMPERPPPRPRGARPAAAAGLAASQCATASR